MSTTTKLLLPPAIPSAGCSSRPTPTTSAPSPSNASETGDTYLNVVTPNPTAPLPPATGWPPCRLATATVNDGVVNLFWAAGHSTTPSPRRAESVPVGLVTGTTATDNRQHPYFRTELMQKAMNLTTVRTHQYAVWITVGFFEVKRQGDLLMAGSGGGNSGCHAGLRHPRPRGRRLDRPDDAVPGLLPGRPAQAHRLRRHDPRQLPPGRRLSPDHRVSNDADLEEGRPLRRVL